MKNKWLWVYNSIVILASLLIFIYPQASAYDVVVSSASIITGCTIIYLCIWMFRKRLHPAAAGGIGLGVWWFMLVVSSIFIFRHTHF